MPNSFIGVNFCLICYYCDTCDTFFVVVAINITIKILLSSIYTFLKAVFFKHFWPKLPKIFARKFCNCFQSWTSHKCNLVYFGEVRCNLVQIGAVWFTLVKFGADWCSWVQIGAECCCDAVWCNLVQIGEIYCRLLYIAEVW